MCQCFEICDSDKRRNYEGGLWSIRTDILYLNAMSSSYTPPRKVILTKEQLEHFQSSAAHETIINYIESLNTAVTGVKLTDQCTISPVSKCCTRVAGARVLSSVSEGGKSDNRCLAKSGRSNKGDTPRGQ